VKDRNPEATYSIRPVRSSEFELSRGIINLAAEAYRGHIADDCWHEPYMTSENFDADIAAGAVFFAAVAGDELVGVMALQPVLDANVVRHAYVLPAWQGLGVGGALLDHFLKQNDRRLLVGTWAAATWAIRFYERHGFVRPSPAVERLLLNTYWNIPERQRDISVALVHGSDE
jgi:GNAT superfamily N-acetyltransferase